MRVDFQILAHFEIDILRLIKLHEQISIAFLDASNKYVALHNSRISRKYDSFLFFFDVK